MAVDSSADESTQLSRASDNQAQHWEIAYPIEVSQMLCGVVVLELGNRAEPELQSALRELHWGIAWLVDRMRRSQNDQAAAIQQRVMCVLDLAATAVEQTKFKAAASAFLTELATRLDCDRVSIGFVADQKTSLATISHSANFKEQSNLVRSIEAAMDEAIDQEAAIIYPAFEHDQRARVLLANQQLCQLTKGNSVATVPFGHDGQWIGAATLERGGDRRFQQADIELCQAAVALAGPMLNIARAEDRWIGRKLNESLKETLSRFFGPGYVLWKACGLFALFIIFVLSVTTGDYRVRADAAMEGRIHRAVVAPFDGFIDQANARAGEYVKEGQVLAVLDDNDLQLERSKWLSQRDQYQKELRQTKADGDKARIGILTAQIEQAEAQLALVEDQLARTEIRAPYDGIVVSGDLSKNLGAPLDKGELLFEVAPLDQYRLAMQVDDRDIRQLKIGQGGDLILSAVPDAEFPFVINLITPVASTEEGRNYFRVEAELTENSPRLRPGMEGIGKIEIGERKMIWIWTHRFSEWLKLQLWSWWP
ncbi:MAG: efflux RND transporter periplasmic adaptor subunit [Proteobacteria bacterium]|nr:efflux RND transporter periplasmic adaptor subunit [Pseudomonadota bacterium]